MEGTTRREVGEQCINGDIMILTVRNRRREKAHAALLKIYSFDEAATNLQRLWRGLRDRRRALAMRTRLRRPGREGAQRQIAAWWRVLLIRRAFRVEVARKHHAASWMQWVWRRRCMQRWLRQKRAVKIITRAFRRLQRRRRQEQHQVVVALLRNRVKKEVEAAEEARREEVAAEETLHNESLLIMQSFARQVLAKI